MLPNRPIAIAAIFVLPFSVWAAVDWFVALPENAKAQYVGRDTCAECHPSQTELWTGSHHDQAMAVATEESVLGDFDHAEFSRLGVTTRMFRRGEQFWVNTEGPDGGLHDYQVKYTFGVTPLQQYMIELPDGRVQVLRVSWDTKQKKWFYVPPPDARDERLMPGDPLHWTGLAQNWNTMCAECHSTHLQKNYDLEKNVYHTTYSEIDVSCEACHGPGSLHVELAGSRSLFWDRKRGYALAQLKGPPVKGTRLENTGNQKQIEACAPCHSRRAPILDNYHAGKRFEDYYSPVLLTPGLYHADGQILDEVYVYGSFLQSKMYAEGVKCSDCHDSHSLKLKYSGNRLCEQCHQPGKYDSPSHHHHQPETPAALCINCHMPSRTYMEIDPRRDHSLRIPRPDLSVQLGTPNACNDCHQKPEESAQWAADAVRQWYGDGQPGDRQPGIKRGPHYGVALAAAREGKPEGAALVRRLLRRKDTPDIVRATAIDLLDGLVTASGVGDDPARDNFSTIPQRNNLSTTTQAADLSALSHEALMHKNPLVRAAAVRTISVDVLNHSIDDVAGRLDDPVRLVRMAAARRLVAVGNRLADSRFRESLDRAVEEYRLGQLVMSDRAGSHLNLASMYEMLGKRRAASDSLRTAIRVEPYLTGPRGELARLLDLRGGEDASIGANFKAEVRSLRQQEVDLLARDFQLLPGDPTLRYRQGMLLYLLDEPDRALVALRAACNLAPNAYQSWLALALLCEKQQLWDEALGALGQMHKLRPGDPAIGGIYVRMQQAMGKGK